MNTANKITLIRIALVPLFIILWKIPSELCHWLAAATFVVAAITDGVDGYVARHYNQVTNFGKFIDPLADKLLVTAALICFVASGDVPDWVTVVILAREFMVTSLRTVAVAQNVVIAASIWGKVKTVVQIILVVAIMVLPDYPVFEILKQILIYAALIITVLSGADYMWKNRACIKAE
jgi:CDP-diacylglycerol--glycerol-3-phosphate 3-phosphatidyltransferase